MERAGKHGDHTTQHDEGTAFRPGDYFSGLLGWMQNALDAKSKLKGAMLPSEACPKQNILVVRITLAPLRRGLFLFKRGS